LSYGKTVTVLSLIHSADHIRMLKKICQIIAHEIFENTNADLPEISHLSHGVAKLGGLITNPKISYF
jgi:hypothetical protein